MALSPRDRRALGWGGAVIVVLLLYLALRGSDGGERPRGNAIASNDLAATVPIVAPAPPLAAAPMPVAVAAPGQDLAQLHLVGTLSSGAVIAMPDGTQRFVATGREVLPGLRLVRVGVHEAILSGGAGETRLGFDAAPATPPGQAP